MTLNLQTPDDREDEREEKRGLWSPMYPPGIARTWGFDWETVNDRLADGSINDRIAYIIGDTIMAGVHGRLAHWPLESLGGRMLSGGVDGKLASHVLDLIARLRREKHG